MKYYKLAKDLPTFEKGELFYMDGSGSLCRAKDDILAYYYTTVAKFPNILGDWFVEIPAPERDSKTKHAFMEYLSNHREERFFQAVRNFADDYLRCDEYLNCIAYIKVDDYNVQNSPVDTFYWECDKMLKEDDEVQS